MGEVLGIAEAAAQSELTRLAEDLGAVDVVLGDEHRAPLTPPTAPARAQLP